MSKELTLSEKFINVWTELYADDEIREFLTREECKVMNEVETALKEKESIENSINELFSGKDGKVITTIDIKNKLKTLEIIKECCEFDFIKKEENDKPIRYEIHIRRKGGDNIFFPCLAIYPKNQEDFDLLKKVLL